MRLIPLLCLTVIALTPIPQSQAQDMCTEVEKHFKIETATNNHVYNMACCAARKNNIEQAFEYLNLAIERGFSDHQWMAKDKDLKVLQTDKRWSGIINGAKAKEAAYLAQINVPLYQMYQQDQAARTGDGDIDWDEITKQDRQRRQVVTKMIEKGELKHADDYFHAAMIFQHGETAEDSKQAQLLALRAVELDPKHRTAQWLSCAAEDRYLHRSDKPQIWGTQYRRPGGEGQWTMEPFDKEAKTDEQRLACGVRTLEQSMLRMAKMNENLKNN